MRGTRAHRARASPSGPLSLRACRQDGSCDIATVMFGFHEMPADARRRVLRNALRIARKKVLIVDIWPGFQPTAMMLSGEPFVLDYLANVRAAAAAALPLAFGPPFQPSVPSPHPHPSGTVGRTAKPHG